MSFSNTQTAILELLEANGLALIDIEKAFQLLDGRQIDYCDFYFQKNISEGFGLEEGIIKSGSYNVDMGVGVRAVQGEKSALAYSDEISQKSLFEAVRTVRSIGRTSHTQNRIKIAAKREPKHLYTTCNPIEKLDTLKKINLLHKLEAMAKQKSPLVTQVLCTVASSHDIILIARSDGKVIGDVRPLVRMNITVFVEKGDRRETASSGGGGRFELDYFTDEILEKYASQAVDAAIRNLEARPSPAGVFPVVLGKGWPGVLLHEAVGHGLEADFNRKETSLFSGKIGQKVAAESVTVVDDGTIANRRGSLTIDDEGNPTQCTTLIDEGILKGYMQDEVNASLMKQPLTGNGRRESFAYLPLPRMTNTYMLKGEKDPGEIIESVDYGIYATNFGGGQVDITNGNFVFSMSEAWLIEKGKLSYPIKGATLIGNGADALTKIKLVGNDLELDSGVGACGKDGQSVPVGVGMPTIRIDGLTVGGTS